MPEFILDAASIWIKPLLLHLKLNSMKNAFGLLWNYLLFVSFDCHSTSNFLVDWNCTQWSLDLGKGLSAEQNLGLLRKWTRKCSDHWYFLGQRNENALLSAAPSWQFLPPAWYETRQLPSVSTPLSSRQVKGTKAGPTSSPWVVFPPLNFVVPNV